MALTCKDIANWWRERSVTEKLVAANVAVFIVLHLLAATNIFVGNNNVERAALRAVELPSNIHEFARRPWTIATYMFAQFDVFHILFNMIWLFWFGKFFEEVKGGRNAMILYLSGGLCGAMAFLVMSNFASSSSNSYLIGSSASVLAIAAAIALITPNREIRLMFLGDVKLKWIAVVLLAFDLINLGSSDGVAHISHLGGAIAGVAYATFFAKLKRKSSITSSKPRTIDSDKVEFNEEELNRILDKIKNSGYASLSTDERHALLSMSVAIRQKGNKRR